jgi:hypothetical protein
MAQAQNPDPVKLFFGLLFSDEAGLNAARQALTSGFGPIDYESEIYPFQHTDYYQAEMGGPLFRKFLSVQPLVSPEYLADIKIRSMAMESCLADIHGQRQVNIDPGYLDYCKLVLASCKWGGQKIYLRQGVYADLTLYYQKGTFTFFPWTFPDFKFPLYYPALLSIRAIYKKQIKPVVS